MSDITDYDVLVDNASSYWVLDSEIELIHSETAYGKQTVAIYHGPVKQNQTYYLSEDSKDSIETAINLYQDINSILLSTDEFKLVLEDNNLK